MPKDVDTLSLQLQKFGLEKEESQIYELLAKRGLMSAGQISKTLSIPRGSVYRFLDNLILTQLIKEIQSPNGRKFEAGSINNLKTILEERKNEVKDLESSFSSIEKIVKDISIPDIAKTKIISYEGIKGLEQITWNSSKAKDELRIIEFSTMSQFLDFGFSEKARTEFLLNKVHVKEITNLKSVPAWTEITQFAMDYWDCRYIPKSLFEVTFEILTYNDVYTMYNYKDNDIVGVEIYNQKLSEMQKQIFDYLWEGATPLIKKGKNGACSIR